MAETHPKQNNPSKTNNVRKQGIILTSSLVSGLILGLICHNFGKEVTQPIIEGSEMVVNLFLRLIKMIVAPLVLATLVAGIGNMQDTKTIKSIGLKVILWFIAASFVSLGVGMIAANLIQPGKGFPTNVDTGAAITIAHSPFSITEFILHIVPTSVVDAMAQNNMLQLVVFAVIFGLALAALPDQKCQLVRDFADAIGKIMLRVTDMIMTIVPLVVFASLLSITTRNGNQVIGRYGLYLLEFYAVILVMFVLLVGTGYLMMGKKIFQLLSFLTEPVLVGFATASSESAFPRLLEQLEKFGVSPKIAGFVVPLGYSFNLCGTMVFLSFAAIFIAQAYNIHMPLDKQLMMLLVMMVSSKGIAGVPRASMVMLATVMPHFGIPETGLGLIFAIDQFLDMARTATSVLGNGIIAAIANEWDVKAQTKKVDRKSVV